MPAKKRTKRQRLHDLIETEQMYLQCVPQWKIAERIGVSQKQIEYDLAQIREEWKKRYAAPVEEEKRKTLQELDMLRNVYWQAWVDSGGDSTILTQIESADGWSRQTRTESPAIGNLQALEGFQRCIQQKRAILGFDAPKKTAMTDTEGRDVDFESLRGMFVIAVGGVQPEAMSESSDADDD